MTQHRGNHGRILPRPQKEPRCLPFNNANSGLARTSTLLPSKLVNALVDATRNAMPALS